jgi:hypothetical protein
MVTDRPVPPSGDAQQAIAQALMKGLDYVPDAELVEAALEEAADVLAAVVVGDRTVADAILLLQLVQNAREDDIWGWLIDVRAPNGNTVTTGVLDTYTAGDLLRYLRAVKA